MENISFIEFSMQCLLSFASPRIASFYYCVHVFSISYVSDFPKYARFFNQFYYTAFKSTIYLSMMSGEVDQ